MSNSVSLQKAIEYVEALSPEDQDVLWELIQQRRRRKQFKIQNSKFKIGKVFDSKGFQHLAPCNLNARQRREIANNAALTRSAMEAGTAKRGTLEE